MLLLAGCQSSASRLPPQFVYQIDTSRPLARMTKARAPAHAPDAKFGYHHLIPAGTIVEVLGRKDGWVQIVSPSEARPGASLYFAWMPEDFLEGIPGPRGTWPSIAPAGSQTPPSSPAASVRGTAQRAGLRTSNDMAIEGVTFDCRRDSMMMIDRDGYSHCEVGFSVTMRLPSEGAWLATVTCDIDLEARAPDDYISRNISGYTLESFFGRSGIATTYHRTRISVLPIYGDGPNRVRLSDIRCNANPRRFS